MFAVAVDGCTICLQLQLALAGDTCVAVAFDTVRLTFAFDICMHLTFPVDISV